MIQDYEVRDRTDLPPEDDSPELEELREEILDNEGADYDPNDRVRAWQLWLEDHGYEDYSADELVDDLVEREEASLGHHHDSLVDEVRGN